MFLLSLRHRRDDGAYAVQDSNGDKVLFLFEEEDDACLLYTSPSPRDMSASRMPSSA